MSQTQAKFPTPTPKLTEKGTENRLASVAIYKRHILGEGNRRNKHRESEEKEEEKAGKRREGVGKGGRAQHPDWILLGAPSTLLWSRFN